MKYADAVEIAEMLMRQRGSRAIPFARQQLDLAEKQRNDISTRAWRAVLAALFDASFPRLAYDAGGSDAENVLPATLG